MLFATIDSFLLCENCGNYQDETKGLCYLRARYYDSATGRFISADSYSGSVADFVSLQQ